MKKLFIALFLLGLAVRLYCLMRPGFLPDIGLYLVWMRSIDAYGLFRAYTDRVIVYPPMYPMILWFLSLIFNLLHIPLTHLSFASTFLLKLPSVIFDVGITWIVFRLVRSLKKDVSIAWTAGLLYFLNPAVIFDGAAWGQIDSIPNFFMVLAFASYFWRMPVLSGIAVALGLFSKQTIVIILPILILMWLKKSPRSLFTFIASSTSSFAIVHIPFLLHGQGPRIYETYAMSVGFVTSLSHNAWNLWWPISRVVHVEDTMTFFNIHGFLMTYRQFGMGLLGIAVAATLVKTLRASTFLQLTAYVALTLFSFFMLPTQMHERYAFPTVVFLAVVTALDRRALVYYVIFTILFLSNLVYVFPIHALIGRGFSWSTILYTDWFGIYAAFGFMMLYVLFFRFVLRLKAKAHPPMP